MSISNLETYEEFEELFALYKAHEADINMGFKFSDSLVKAEVLKCILHPDEYFCNLIRNAEGLLVGFFLGRVGRPYLSLELEAKDIACYVIPEHRNFQTRAQFGKAVHNFEAWAKECGAIRVWITTYGDYIRRLQKHGYTTTSTLLYKEV